MLLPRMTACLLNQSTRKAITDWISTRYYALLGTARCILAFVKPASALCAYASHHGGDDLVAVLRGAALGIWTELLEYEQPCGRAGLMQLMISTHQLTRI